jgi:catechol 2,3-dioxygenase-like lactoylglutathione lyase family enzyme
LKSFRTEVTGAAYEHLHGVFGLRLRLGDECIVLTEYVALKGHPAPVDARSNDHWFQHIAIMVSDMERAYQWLRQHKVDGARFSRTATLAGLAPQRRWDHGLLLQRPGWSHAGDVRTDDLVHWQTALVVHDVGAAAHQARTGLWRWVSPGKVVLPDKHPGFSKGLLVRDPDGHVMQLVEP